MFLLKEIIGNTWLLEPGYINRVMPFIKDMLTGKNPVWEQTAPQPAQVFTPAAGSVLEAAAPIAAAQVPQGSVLVYKITGALMKYDQACGPKGTATMAAELTQWAANPNIAGIVLYIDSPGGTVAGTEELAATLQAITKPIVAYASDTMASAAMWIGSNAQHIMISGNTTMVGSIGTRLTWANLKPALKKAGVEFHDIRATKSVHKGTDIDAAENGDYSAIVQNLLDPVNEAFIAAIKKNRGDKIDAEKEDVFTAKVYIGKQAIKAGLADSMGTLQDAVALVQKMAKQPKKIPVGVSTNRNQKPHTMKIAEKYPALHAVAQIEAEAELLDDGSAPVTAEEFARIEAGLSAVQQQQEASAALSAQNESLTARVAELEQQLSEAQALAENNANTAVQLQEQLTQAQTNLHAAQAEVEALKNEAPDLTDTLPGQKPKTAKKSYNSLDAYADKFLSK